MDIPGYEIAGLLGTGGFGTVYRATQLAVRREVALKIDSRTLATDRDKRRFMREVTAAGRLSGHPHVVAVHDAGVLADGRPYMVLELCPGGSLNDRLREGGPFPAAEVRDIGIRVADALAAAHDAGVLHRDVKPGNILVDRYGNVALADFGLAAMTGPGMESSATRGSLTPAYAPPEAFQQAEPDAAGDIYSLAASLYALLAGRPPHFPPDRQLSIAELMAAHSRPVPDPPGTPPALLSVLRQGMAFHPADRPPSAAWLRDALAAADLSATAPAPAAITTAPPVSLISPVPPAQTGRAGPGTAAAGLRSPGSAAGPASAGRVRAHRGLTRGLVLGTGALIAAGLVGAAALVTLTGPGGALDQGGAGAPAGRPSLGGAAGNQAGDAPTGGKAGARGYGGYGVPTVTRDCPAAAVQGGRAGCPQTAECWGGIVSIAGDSRATRYDCRAKHTWETFAIALMPRDAETWNATELARNPTVAGVCSRAVLLGSRRGAGLNRPARAWEVAVLPPSQSAFDQGDRAYRCMATRGLDTMRGSSFRPLS